MMRRLAALAIFLFAASAFAQPSVRGGGGLSRAIADALYCKLAGCTMTGKLRFINGTAAAPSADSAAGAGFHLTATAFAIDVGGNTSTICGQGCATVSGGTYGWSSSATDATAAADTVLSRPAAGFVAATTGFSGVYRITTRAITNANSPYAVVATDGVITCDATAGAVVINLPAATGTGRKIDIKKIDATTNACTPTRAGADTIDGATSYSLTTQYASSAIVDTASGAWSRTHVNQVGGVLSGVSTNLTIASQTGTGTKFVMDTNPALVGPTTDTLQTSGNVGIGTAPSATPGSFLQAASAFDAQTRIGISNTNATGTSANAGLQASADVATVVLAAHGSGRAVSRWGAAVGGWSEVLVSAGNGLAVGTSTATPLKLGTGGVTAISVDTSQIVTFSTSAISPLWRSTTAKFLVQGTGTGATQLATTQTTAPTCTTNCGTSPSVTGTDTAGFVTMGGTGSPASGWVVTFNGTWAAAPACNVQSALATMVVGKMPIAVVTTTTTMTVTTNGTAPANSDKYQFICVGIQ